MKSKEAETRCLLWAKEMEQLYHHSLSGVGVNFTFEIKIKCRRHE